jgi:CAAX protease family protein
MNWRLIGWASVVAFMTALAYAALLTDSHPPKDVAYRWESSISGAVQYAILLGVVMLLTRGLDRRAFLAFRPPTSWPRALGISAVVIVTVLIVGAVVSQFGNPEKEQGLIPDRFDSSRVAQFAAYTAIVVLVAPFVEELLFRGVGYGLLEPFGTRVAIPVVGISFALVHGLVAGFLVIATFGTGLAYLRGRTNSIYPCMLLHASFNAFGLAVGIATGS